MKKSITLIITVILLALFVCLSVYPHLAYVFKTSFDDMNETWNRYVITFGSNDKESFYEVKMDSTPIKIVKENDEVKVEFDQKVCSFTYDKGGRKYYKCNESSNLSIEFNQQYDAFIIKEFPDDKDENDGVYYGLPVYHLAVSDNKRYFDESLSDIIELIEEISHIAVGY